MSDANTPKMPCPTKEHEWLQRFVGEWKSEVSFLQPGQPPQQSTGGEKIRAVGGFWVVSEVEGKCPSTGERFESRLQLGFDPQKQKYIGTWVDSMTSLLWVYEGTVDESGNVLTLFTEGACPMSPGGQPSKFREVTEFKGNDEKVFTASIQGPDGQWNPMLEVTARRIR